jgi:hypothetical protein
MTDKPSSPHLGIKFLHMLEKMQAEIGAENTAAVLNEMTDIFNIVRDGFDSEGPTLLQNLREAIKLYDMAAEAAEEGKAIGPIWKVGKVIHVEKGLVPGSLAAVYQKAVEDNDRRRGIHLVANDPAPLTHA